MKSIIEHIALVTQLLGTPISVATLMAQVTQDQNLQVNYHSLGEVLKTHGFDNTLAQRNLQDIPSLAMPVVVVLKDEHAAVITHIDGVGDERVYEIQQTDGLKQKLTQQQLNELYRHCCK